MFPIFSDADIDTIETTWFVVTALEEVVCLTSAESVSCDINNGGSRLVDLVCRVCHDTLRCLLDDFGGV